MWWFNTWVVPIIVRFQQYVQPVETRKGYSALEELSAEAEEVPHVICHNRGPPDVRPPLCWISANMIRMF